MSRINSRQKGARGERECAAYLRSIGIADCRRGQQFSGSKDSPDVVTSLTNVHIECKFGVGGLDLGTDLLDKAINQARNDKGDAKRWCVLWKPMRKSWRMTFAWPSNGTVCTVTGPATICSILQQLNQGE